MENKELEKQIYDYTTGFYIKTVTHFEKFKDDNMFEGFLKQLSGSEEINLYSLYTLKILHLVDKEITSELFFDQYYGFAPIKTSHTEGNDFIHNNEIHCLLSELYNKCEDYRINKQVCMRVRSLTILNVWNHLIDCETLIFGDYETKNYKEKFKKYVYDHPKYLRYSRLLKAALNAGKVMNKTDPLPISMKEYQQFLKDPLVYVMLEPYNHIKEEILLKNIFFNEGKLDII
jgi:hypothetical protein